MGRRNIFSLIIGATIGTVTAMLFAPVRGRELRKKVKDEIKKGGAGVNSIGQECKKMWDEMKDTFKEITQTDEVQEVIKKGKKVLHEVKEKGDEALDKITNDVSSEFQEAKEKATQVIKKKSKQLRSKAKKVMNGTTGKK
ncbi:MAG: hypothetical protein UR28_C0002G0039 [Candidatus Peregrinibacteria bacterium GW2011_GWF2_33_10]|nr:MAG: hypothetical protein UR28_C0002G0039 [Candidatus Peregrinibacteria bacterium GW2011_GWF2_33_10]OGJ45618.1 MAG: hypothetical protein A2263_00770 [Candidatus Peregrinibacteria bacterium RIFOXYA2_FULL_33_21]OGJ51209.1 MAG: hypothetical protein A2307_01150 [Candidatus Peregrinibacteria bacterium RIFOXYB2_FULL_33_20]